MKFGYSDAWLLEAIKLSETRDKGATLTDIIQAADYINHAIMTNSEFATGTRKLKNLGLIIEKDKKLQTTDKFNEWWTKKYGQKSRFSILKAMEEIEKYLNKNYETIEDSTKGKDTEITDADFDRATAEYHKLAQAELNKIIKKKKDK
jgi:hypothetical protein